MEDKLKSTTTDNNTDSKLEDQDIPETTTETTADTKEEGSGIYTTDGKELPKIDGGYTIVGGPGGTLGENKFVS